MSRQRNPRNYSLHIYVDIEDAVRMKTLCEARLVENKSRKTLRPMAISNLAAEFIHNDVKNVEPSADAVAWGKEQLENLMASRKRADKAVAEGQFKAVDRIGERRRAAVRKSQGLTSRPRPIKKVVRADA